MNGNPAFQRETLQERVTGRTEPWDVIVVGGGATGLGVAVDAANRGYETLLLDKSDFGKATSSRSTKLVHGGVRYLQQGNVSLVFEALHERGILLENAPHLTRNLEFVIPCYRWWEKPYYGTGLKLYDVLAGKRSLGGSTVLSRRRAVEMMPGARRSGLRGGVKYHDGQFDDARLAVNLAQTAVEQGGTVLNYTAVTGLMKANGRVAGVKAREAESGAEWSIPGRVVINATGVFADDIRQMDRPDATPMIRPSQGAHIVVDRSFLPGDAALMIPKTDDGRVLFAVPWHDVVIIGTTDTPLDTVGLEPRALDEEVDFLLEHAGRYLDRQIRPADVRSVFAGLRPLVSTDGTDDTAAISRDHVLCVSESGLVTITGGKWTTYRRMAKDTVDRAAEVGSLGERPCGTKKLRIHGWTSVVNRDAPYGIYGSDATALSALTSALPEGSNRIHPDLSVTEAEIRWAVRNEMARTVDDVLARRTRSLLLNARASIEAAEEVAERMADELGRTAGWVASQTKQFREMAGSYILDAAVTPADSSPTQQGSSLDD